MQTPPQSAAGRFATRLRRRRLVASLIAALPAMGASGCGEPAEMRDLKAAPTGRHFWHAAPTDQAEQRAHPQELPPSRWAVVEAPFVPTAAVAAEAFAHAHQATVCRQTQGLWHAGLWACRCPRHTAFVPRHGCAPLPPIVAAQSFCTQAWSTSKTACLRDIQVGRSAWHLHFSGRAARTRAVRAALVDADIAALMGHTLSLPPAAAPWSMHVTDRLGPQTTAYLGFDDAKATLSPDQYTQAWVRPTDAHTAAQDAPRLAQTCRKALARQALLPGDIAATLCQYAAAALVQVHDAGARAWPQARSAVWLTEPRPELPAEARLGALTWQLQVPLDGHVDRADAASLARAVATRWRVVLRDETVLARQLQVHYEAPEQADNAAGGVADRSDSRSVAHKPTGAGAAPPGRLLPAPVASWILTLVCDGAGAVQAWHIVAPQAPVATGLLLPCHRALQPRRKAPRGRPHRSAADAPAL